MVADDEWLHMRARDMASTLVDPDRKQLRFNYIVEVAKLFYNDPFEGVQELVKSCDRRSPAYVKGQPMAETLRTQYAWMIAA